MRFLVVNFHYIGGESMYSRGIYPVSIERFSNQLISLGRLFTFISGKDLQEALEGKKVLPDQACLITFDDGLACQCDILPVLESHKVSALFFIPTGPYETGTVLQVHKIHWLLAHLEPQLLSFLVLSSAQQHIGKISSFEMISKDAVKKYRYDTEDVAVIKYLLNSFLDRSLREKIITTIFAEYVSDEKGFMNDLYMSSSTIAELGQREWVGIHGHNHTPLTGNRATLELELRTSKEILERMSGPIFSVSYPYGNVLDIDASVVDIGRELGLSFGFTMERAFNTTLDEPLLFARADTNDVLGGKRPLIKTQSDGSLVFDKGFTKSRSIFLKEGA